MPITYNDADKQPVDSMLADKVAFVVLLYVVAAEALLRGTNMLITSVSIASISRVPFLVIAFILFSPSFRLILVYCKPKLNPGIAFT